MIHADRDSDRLNRSVRATAFTTGRHLFFRAGAYAPGTRAGQELLAHELAHVLQQCPTSQAAPEPADTGLAAGASARPNAAGTAAISVTPVASPIIQRQVRWYEDGKDKSKILRESNVNQLYSMIFDDAETRRIFWRLITRLGHQNFNDASYEDVIKFLIWFETYPRDFNAFDSFNAMVKSMDEKLSVYLVLEKGVDPGEGAPSLMATPGGSSSSTTSTAPKYSTPQPSGSQQSTGIAPAPSSNTNRPPLNPAPLPGDTKSAAKTSPVPLVTAVGKIGAENPVVRGWQFWKISRNMPDLPALPAEHASSTPGTLVAETTSSQTTNTTTTSTATTTSSTPPGSVPVAPHSSAAATLSTASTSTSTQFLPPSAAPTTSAASSSQGPPSGSEPGVDFDWSGATFKELGGGTISHVYRFTDPTRNDTDATVIVKTLRANEPEFVDFSEMFFLQMGMFTAGARFIKPGEKEYQILGNKLMLPSLDRYFIAGKDEKKPVTAFLVMRDLEAEGARSISEMLANAKTVEEIKKLVSLIADPHVLVTIGQFIVYDPAIGNTDRFSFAKQNLGNIMLRGPQGGQGTKVFAIDTTAEVNMTKLLNYVQEHGGIYFGDLVPDNQIFVNMFNEQKRKEFIGRLLELPLSEFDEEVKNKTEISEETKGAMRRLLVRLKTPKNIALVEGGMSSAFLKLLTVMSDPTDDRHKKIKEAAGSTHAFEILKANVSYLESRAISYGSKEAGEAHKEAARSVEIFGRYHLTGLTPESPQLTHQDPASYPVFKESKELLKKPFFVRIDKTIFHPEEHKRDEEGAIETFLKDFGLFWNDITAIKEYADLLDLEFQNASKVAVAPGADTASKKKEGDEHVGSEQVASSKPFIYPGKDRAVNLLNKPRARSDWLKEILGLAEKAYAWVVFCLDRLEKYRAYIPQMDDRFRTRVNEWLTSRGVNLDTIYNQLVTRGRNLNQFIQKARDEL
jgi:hypothetical protein